MCSPTLGRRHISVKSAGGPSVDQATWKNTSAFTLEKNHANAHSANLQVFTIFHFENIQRSIQKKVCQCSTKIVKKKQSKEKPHKYTQCNFASSYASQLRVHIKTHSLQKPNKCEWCDYSTTTSSNLTRHLLTHSGEKPHHCKECGSSFSQAETLKVHRRTHSGEKTYKCTKCDYASAESSSLRKHTTKKHIDVVE